MLPLWEGAMGGMCSTRPVDVVAPDAPCRNGSKSREMVPLWKWEKGGKCPMRLVDGVASDAPYRNGSKSREMLPLWKEPSVYRPMMRACWGPMVRTGPERVPRPSTEMRPSRQ